MAMNDVLQTLAAESARLAALEEDLRAREIILAEGFEQLTMAQRDSATWAAASAERDRHWTAMINMQLEQLTPQSSTATVLRHLRGMGVGQDSTQVEG